MLCVLRALTISPNCEVYFAQYTLDTIFYVFTIESRPSNSNITLLKVGRTSTLGSQHCFSMVDICSGILAV